MKIKTAKMFGHFGISLMVPKCLESELFWVSVCTFETSRL